MLQLVLSGYLGLANERKPGHSFSRNSDSNSPSGLTFLCSPDVGGRTFGNNAAAFGTAAGPKVNDPVGVPDDVEVVLDHNHGCAVFNQSLEYLEERQHVERMQADRRLVEDKDGIGLGLSHFGGKLEALRLAA